ncbi:DUF1330 domain-containing protein [Nocardia sp. CDC159]|uniref:DUF1330 domain-containing protein n=1 Tax=Nocardia pulmonis TaxID=2951408 RepID=A0A9X2EF63_9NOCA|nr:MULTISPECIES: DUF1330 domain-containing protein [Nocardia]MCM6777091.1 DUF1330 domain-containing protein [Nocardia pulmonis]MCM6789976.1 DUF1330 domain-containing protein [Nocardia sp. CDC159]
MTAYAIAHLHNVDRNAEIVTYLRRIDATLAPFGGRFIVHGGRQQVAEGPADGTFIVIEFPDYEAAQGWYASPAYQEILPLRLHNAEGIASLAEHCGDDHVATDVLPAALLEN